MKPDGFLYDLESLREIGWRTWDPIGLRDLRHHHEDEYDAYLLQAAGHAVRGKSEEELAEFLTICCSEMGVKADEATSLGAARAIIAHIEKARAPAT